MAGQNHLFDMADLAGMQRLRQLFEAFTEKHLILHLFGSVLEKLWTAYKFSIGGESGHDVLNDCSMVTAPYTVANKVVGAVGVIGPTRMAYDSRDSHGWGNRKITQCSLESVILVPI